MSHRSIALALSRKGLHQLAIEVTALGRATHEERADPTENTVGKFSARQAETSSEAAYRVEQKTGTQRSIILQYLSLIHPEGATDEEMQGTLTIAANTQRPRRVELVEMKWVADSGDRRKTRAGLDAVVWRFCPDD